MRSATISNVLSAGDLALLRVVSPPNIPALRVATSARDKGAEYAGFGYQNGQPTAGDQKVTFSTGSSYLRDILPREAANELRNGGSRIDLNREVLRFNVALQPGMSGGPIVNAAGEVIGIVAGGLKAGAAPASWGWPSEWVASLRASTDATTQSVLTARAYYTLAEMSAERAATDSGRSVTCGTMTFRYHGRRSFSGVSRGSDDEARLRYVMLMSTLPSATIELMEFDVWVHASSGATVVTPAGYAVTRSQLACEVRSTTGPFRQVIWGAPAVDATAVQLTSQQFEAAVMAPLAPYQFGFQIDNSLTTFGPQFRENGLVFNRKGFSQPKQPVIFGGPIPPLAHTFETLIAKNGFFIGVGTLNDNVPSAMALCAQSGGAMPGCVEVRRHLEEWTRFILATQLSTFPAT